LPIDSFRPGVPDWVDQILTRALQKRPEDRFQSATEFHGALQHALVGMATPTSSLAPTGKMPTARPAPVDAHAETMATPVATASARVVPVATPAAEVASAAQPVAGPPVPTATAPSAAPPAAAPAAPARAGSSRGTLTGLAAGVLLIVAAGGWWLMSSRQTGVAAPMPAVNAAQDVALPSAGPLPAGTPTVDADAATATGAPPTDGAGRGVAEGAAPTTAATGRARGGSEPASTSASAPSAAAPVPPIDTAPTVSITDIKVMVVDGRRTSERDVVLNLADGRIVAVSDDDDGATLASWPYRAVTAASYTHARRPRWDPALAAPPDDLDIGGFFRTSRHYLTLQNADDYIILRLENVNVIQVIRELEARTGLSIPRTND
jgi:hypothetical protein